MFKRKSNAFTLIELIAILVIMAIIALIVTPLVMTIIRKARISADRRSVDAYGRSVELAIAGYLLDNGKFPTSVEQLTIEYSGNEVVCSTTQLNSDSSVYLAGCTVNGRSVDYTYGEDKNPVTYDAYEVGDEVTYNGENYYVIKNSDTTQSTLTLLKAEPLKLAEVTEYISNDNINVYDENGYGNIPYSGSDNEYSTSYVKSVVDAWASDVVNGSDLTEARLITYDELNAQETQVEKPWGTETIYSVGYNWLYSSNYNYWGMTKPSENPSHVYSVSTSGDITKANLHGMDTSTNNGRVIRPVIELNKSANITKVN